MTRRLNGAPGGRGRDPHILALLLAAAAGLTLPGLTAAQTDKLGDSPAAPAAEPGDRPAMDPVSEEAAQAGSLPQHIPPNLLDQRSLRLFLAVPFVVVPAVGYAAWWKRDFGVHIHAVNEGWFGEDSYAGGADKASHFYWGTVGEEALTEGFRKLGHPDKQARTLAAAETVLSALVVELGDSMTSYGFSWQDAAATTLGAGAYAFVSSHRLEDTIGFRFGVAPDYARPAESPAHSGIRPASIEPSQDVPSGYSKEIYTMDLKLKGFLPRVGAEPGIGRFFLFSLTYSTKGYNAAPPEQRERNVGLEIGLSFSELFRAAGVRETTWWGNALLIFLDHFRVPYSAIGFHYDLNSGRWYGPDAGNVYDRGPPR